MRCFEDENVIHVSGSVDPLRDVETIELELMLADLAHLASAAQRDTHACGKAEAPSRLGTDSHALPYWATHATHAWTWTNGQIGTAMAMASYSGLIEHCHISHTQADSGPGRYLDP